MRDFFLWILVWVVGIILVAIPQTVYEIMGTLKIQRTADFFFMAGFLFLVLIIFFLYVKLRKMENKIEVVVRKVALKK
jgi:hypothetical protein